MFHLKLLLLKCCPRCHLLWAILIKVNASSAAPPAPHLSSSLVNSIGAQFLKMLADALQANELLDSCDEE